MMQDVLDHPFAAHHIAADGIHLVAVGALDQHGLPVHEQLCVPDLHGTEAHGCVTVSVTPLPSDTAISSV